MSDIRQWMDVAATLCEASEPTPDTDRVVVFHGGRDFDHVDPKKFGTGEPGGIRPLGKGLYGGLAVTPDDLHSAIEIAKHYARKYGGRTPMIHGFEAQLPSKIKHLSYDTQGWARTGGPSWEAEALPWRPTVGANRAKEIAFVDPTLLHRIGKWSVDVPTDQIIHELQGLFESKTAMREIIDALP